MVSRVAEASHDLQCMIGCRKFFILVKACVKPPVAEAVSLVGVYELGRRQLQQWSGSGTRVETGKVVA